MKIEDLKKRFCEVRDHGQYGDSFDILAKDAIRLAEVYRQMALERFKDFPQTAPFYELFVDDEAERLMEKDK